MSASTESRITSHVGSRGYGQGSVAADLGPELVQGAEWSDFLASWDDLRQDPYMADGGTYRWRRYSEFACHAADGRIEVLPHVPYSQTKDINHLNGGIERHYEPFVPEVAEGAVVHNLLAWCLETMTEVAGPASWRCQTFQNRIVASADESGQPAPEGIHRDGVDYVLTLVTGRRNVEGGVSGVHNPTTKETIASVLLAEPGDFLFADDEKVLHSVTPLSPVDAGQPAHRDTFIAMFSRIESE